MYAKSMIESVRERAVAGAWARHLSIVPVLMALVVAVLPFTLEQQPIVSVPSTIPNALRTEQLYALENPFEGRVLANVVTAPKRGVMPLDAQQRAVASFITRKYGVSAEMVQELVRTAFAAGKQFGVDPLLVVAIVAVESSFNPIAESVAGAKGLMQIIPKYHLEKFADFGGEQAVFDPRVNILVGARIVREYLLMASGDLFTALQTYAGALGDRDAAYTNRVLNEKDQIDQLAGFPKTDRGNRVVMQVDPVRPGTLTIPVPGLAPLPGVIAPAVPAPTTPLPPPVALPYPSAKPAEEAAHTPPTQPLQPAPLPSINVTWASADLPIS
jgi:hypothetical protein